VRSQARNVRSGSQSTGQFLAIPILDCNRRTHLAPGGPAQRCLYSRARCS
jgi:hypothetical protein